MLQRLDDGIWCADAVQRMPGGAKLPARMTIVRLDDGLWIYSPVAIDDALAAEIDALGPVRHLVEPNTFHHLHLGPAAARWPEARTYAPPGLRGKRPDLRIDVELREDERPWGEVFELVEIHGAPSIEELAFVHTPSGTLLLGDLLFNVHETPGVMGKVILRLVGAWKKLTQSRLWRRITIDRAAAGRSCHKLLGLEFRRVIPCHGRIEEGDDVRERVRAGLHWMLGGV